MRKKNGFNVSHWIKKSMLFVGIGLCMAASIPAKAAEQVGTVAGHPIFDNEFGGVYIEEGGSTSGLTKRSASFAAKYDPRLTGGVSSRVEDQGQYNTCWAFSTIAAIECNLIKKGYENSSVNLSENHLAYFFYNRQTDPVGYTAGDKNKNTYNTWSQNGGSIEGTALALTTWSGVVKESASEDDKDGAYVPRSLPATDCYKSDYRVMGSYFYNYDVNTVKQAIMDYGAVSCGIYMDENYWNLDNGAYFYPNKAGNHAVTIVGWDDSYSRYNFKSSCRPSRDGAWIVKNSYGTTYKEKIGPGENDYVIKTLGDNGYMYVSYEDASLCEIAAFDMVKASESYDNNYQYDGTGVPGFYYYRPSGTTYANVFKAKMAKSGYNEILRAVGVDVMTSNVQYSLQIYTGVTSSSNPTSGNAVFKTPQTGTITKAGYNHITLNAPVTLISGEKYAVVITLKSPNGGNVKVVCDCSVNAGWVWFEASVGTGQSLIKSGKKWYDAGKVSGASKATIWVDDKNGKPVQADPEHIYYSNIRMKAYTDTTNQKTTYKLSKSLGVSKGSSNTLSLTITPSSVKRKVTWSSSNKNVATVSSSGKIKAKSYGTTTIKAKFVAGSKTKTLSCKVTVGPSKLKSYKVSAGKGKVTVRWKKNSAANGYEIYYSKKEDSGFKKLTTAKASKTKVTKKLKSGTYYVKMRAYKLQGKKKLYGSYTVTKKVTVR